MGIGEKCTVHGLAQNVGRQIRALREKRGWTQRELAGRVGVGKGVVSRWESGQQLPPLQRLVSLARVFDVSFETLLLKPTESEVPRLGLLMRQALLGLPKPEARRGVEALFQLLFALMEMDHEQVKALIGAMELVEGTSRAAKRGGERHV